MSWLSVVAGLFQPARELIEVFKPNAEQEAEPGHVERLMLSQQDLASLQQFAAEFRERPGRTWWDALIDGLNRLPRPLITLGILAFFVLAPLAPVRFLEIAQAYQMMPDGFWALLSVIIAFYFGGRMQLKGRDMAVRGGALGIAREILAIRRAAEAPTEPAVGSLVTLSPDERAAAAAPGVNHVVEEWRQRQSASAQP